jgi:hypothetical protein
VGFRWGPKLAVADGALVGKCGRQRAASAAGLGAQEALHEIRENDALAAFDASVQSCCVKYDRRSSV